jgi:hypothetical protein
MAKNKASMTPLTPARPPPLPTKGLRHRKLTKAGEPDATQHVV